MRAGRTHNRWVTGETAQDSGDGVVDAPEEASVVVGVGEPQRVGSFRFWFADQRWEWSPEVAAMHGYGADEVTPTTELLLAHKHPEDRERVSAAITESIRSGEPFSSRHRIIDTRGQEHQVVVVGTALANDSGTVVGTEGFYVDVTEAAIRQLQAGVTAAVDELSRSRAVIEQAKGMLMFAYGVDANRAFDVLVWRSQQTNIKLRELAAQLVDDLTPVTLPTQVRTRVDQLLITAHQRVDHHRS